MLKSAVMARQSIRFEQFFAAPREKVFAYFSDHERFGRIWPGRTRRVTAATDADPNGLGSVREMQTPLGTVEETITGYDPPCHLEYRASSPRVSNHLGVMDFEEVAGGTRLVYTIEFDFRPAFLGGVAAGYVCASFRRGVHRAIDEISAA